MSNDKNEHLGEYRLYDGIRYQGKAKRRLIQGTTETLCFICMKYAVKNDTDYCVYCTPDRSEVGEVQGGV